MAIAFDGSSVFWKNTSAGTTASKKFTFSSWFKSNSAASALFSIKPSASATARFLVWVSGSDIAVNGRNSGGTLVLIASTTTDTVSLGVWHHLMVSADLENSAVHIYLDDIDITPASPTIVDSAIDFASPIWLIGAFTNASEVPSTFLDGAMMELVFWPGAYLDLSDADNRNKLVANKNGVLSPTAPSSLNNELGQPYIFYEGMWRENLGSGPDLTAQGAVLHTDDPFTDRPTAQYYTTRGQWGRCDLCGWVFEKRYLRVQPSTGRTVCTVGPHDYDDETPPPSDETGRFFI